MQELASFTHTVEDVLDEVREGSVAVTEYIVDVLLKSIDVIKEMLSERSQGRVLEKEPVEVIDALRDVAGLEAPVSAPIAAQNPPTSRELSEYDVLEFQDAVGEGERAYRVSVEFDENNPMNTVGGIQVFAALKDIGKIIKTEPDFDELYKDIFRPMVEYYLVSSEPPRKPRKPNRRKSHGERAALFCGWTANE
jgi:two-component system chemotaxis sensor kinase CheA